MTSPTRRPLVLPGVCEVRVVGEKNRELVARSRTGRVQQGATALRRTPAASLLQTIRAPTRQFVGNLRGSHDRKSFGSRSGSSWSVSSVYSQLDNSQSYFSAKEISRPHRIFSKRVTKATNQGISFGAGHLRLVIAYAGANVHICLKSDDPYSSRAN